MKKSLFLAILLVACFSATAQTSKVKNDKPSSYSSIYDMIRQQPGVMVNNSTNPPSVIIRGIGTNSDETSPMFMIDGIQVTESQVAALTPQEVWSIEIVKDGTAGFYGGMKSANGVVMIVTKGQHETAERAAEAEKMEKQAAREAKKAARQQKKQN